MNTTDITNLSDAKLDTLLSATPTCPMCGSDSTSDGICDLLCIPCANARPDESYLSWGDHDPNYDY